MTGLWILLAAVLFIGFVLAGVLAKAVQWGREFKELQEAGVETTGVVTRKVRYRRRGTETRYIRYEYRDQFGRPHSRKTLVIGDEWETHHEGGPIRIVYSQRNPRVSAAKFLFDSMATAAKARGAGGDGPV